MVAKGQALGLHTVSHITFSDCHFLQTKVSHIRLSPSHKLQGHVVLLATPCDSARIHLLQATGCHTPSAHIHL